MHYCVDKAESPKTDLTLILAHGAGAGMEHPFMIDMAQRIAESGISVVRFDFPYMVWRKQSEKKRPPDRMPVLIDRFRQVVQDHGGVRQCVLAGKSMGGRVASMLLAEQGGCAGISLGYPFHPPKKPNALRNGHWAQIRLPWLIIQGTRDPFGAQKEVMNYELPASAHCSWLPDGDHDFKPRKVSGVTQEQNRVQAAKWVVDFILGLER